MEEKDSGINIVPSLIWIIVLLCVSVVSFIIGRSSVMPTTQTTQTAQVQPTTEQITNPPSSPISPTVAADLEGTCDITGPSQKKEYLKTYILKEGDSLALIAERELGDKTRTSEIIQLNDNSPPMTVGGTLYLPPDDIPQSSGKIFQTSGKIIKKDTVSWQLSYGGGAKGTGIVFPGYWFKDLPQMDEFQLGDCVTILFDNGVKVYSVKKS